MYFAPANPGFWLEELFPGQTWRLIIIIIIINILLIVELMEECQVLLNECHSFLNVSSNLPYQNQLENITYLLV